MHQYKNDCLVCIIKNTYTFILEPVMFVCPQGIKKNFGEVKIRMSTFHLHCTVLLFNIISSITILISIINRNVTIDKLILLNDFVINLMGCVVQFWKLKKLFNTIEYLNAYLYIQGDNSFSIQSLSLAKDIKFLSNIRFTFICFLCLIICSATYEGFFNSIESNYMHSLSYILSCYYQMTFMFSINMFLSVMKAVQKLFSSSIKNSLLLVIPENERWTFYGASTIPYDYHSIVKPSGRISSHQRLLMAIHSNNDILILDSRIYVRIWVIGAIINMCMSIYLMTYTSETVSAHIPKFMRILMMYALSILWTFVLGENVNRFNEEILSFLFKYPISKLSRKDAVQVEMLITTLKLQKPVVRASDTIVIGSRLLASISGTVITYVLVALQFRAAWTKY